ncbi:MAG: DNA polymerase III subunit alpha [Thermoanaerobaculales bacterium]|nr:DNA polymerase III subunit alpha [Thermoanaerobaculales bacterium]
MSSDGIARGPTENPSRSEKREEVRDVLPEGGGRSDFTSMTYGSTDGASVAICSRDGVSGRASNPFVHLHLHSHYSLLDATIKAPLLVKQVKDLGMDSVAITDHGNVFGAFQFVGAAKNADVRPIVGCEVYVAPGDHREKSAARGSEKNFFHLVLLAENQRGYRNLMWLVSQGYLEGFYYKPRISKEILAEHSEGLIGLSACLSGEVAQRLMGRDPVAARRVAEEYREILGKDNFFLEIQNHGMVDEEFVREGVREISRLTAIPTVATNDCHFHYRDDLAAHRTLIGIGRTGSKGGQDYVYNQEFYVKSPEEMYALFEDFPGACERTSEIASRCEIEFDTSTYHLPQFPVPGDEDEGRYFRRVSREGLDRRLAATTVRTCSDEQYRERLESELDIIEQMGFPGYFLVVWDLVRQAREDGIPVGPGRGSAAGSVVSYALQITDIDPLEYDLLFERFLNPERISMPDIDIDFCQRDRYKVIDYVRRRYGDDSVCQIATFNILKAKSAIRDVGRVMEMSYRDVDRIAKLIPDDLGMTIDQALRDTAELRELANGDEDVNQLIEIARRLEGLARHCGVHAAGVVIAPEPLVNLVPLYRTNRDEITTQYDKDDVESLGLLKMDFLGLRTLTVLADAVESARRNDAPDLDLSGLTLDDPAVYDLFSTGDTDGVFQFESSGMKEVLRKVQPRVFNDIAALNALYRPGPMAFIDDYAARKHGRKKIVYIFPELEEILGETYGIIVFQEQVMRIAVKIGGFSLAKADILRKAMGKKKQEIIDQEGENFVKGGVANGFREAKVRQLWDQIVPFAKYGFNKSHSVAYAHVAYLTAYMKAHHPAHFMAAMLTSEVSNTDKLSQYLVRSRQMGIEILPPAVNKSQSFFSADPEGIRFGLSAVKGVGETAVQPILEAREKEGSFTSFSHCLRSVSHRTVNNKVLECLIRAGTFDEFGITRKGLLDNLERFTELTAREREQEEHGQGFLFAERPSESLEEEIQGVGRAEESERLTWEKEVLGFYLTGHPLDRYADQLALFADCGVEVLGERFSAGAEQVSVGGLVEGIKVIPIKKIGPNQGRRMAVFQLEGRNASLRAVAFPDTYEKVAHLLENGNAVLVTASLKGDGDHVELTVENVALLDQVETSRAAALKVVLDLDKVDESKIEELRELLMTHPGGTPVRFELIRRGGFRARLVPPPALSVTPDADLRTAVEALLDGGWTELEYSQPARTQGGDIPNSAPENRRHWVN